jgi:hypothetical protein
MDTLNGKLGGKRNAARVSSPASQKMRISAWDALVWAYAHENVRAAGGFLSLKNDYFQGSGWDSSIEHHTATVRGYLQAHEDAVSIDAFVKVNSGPHHVYMAIYKAAERRAPVPAKLDLPTQKCVPVMVKRNGELVPKLIYPAKGRKEPILCCLDIVGVPQDEIDKAQLRQAAIHTIFLSLLDVMEYRLPLTKWAIAGRGLTDGGESLTQGITFGALRREATKPSI